MTTTVASFPANVSIGASCGRMLLTAARLTQWTALKKATRAPSSRVGAAAEVPRVATVVVPELQGAAAYAPVGVDIGSTPS